jgi:membrane-bound ClpP family serine protease
MRWPGTNKEWQRRGHPLRALGGKLIGLISIVLGVVSIITGLIPCVNIVAIVIGATGIVVGVFAYNQSRHGRGNTAYSVAGILLCILGIVLSILITQGVINMARNSNATEMQHHDF